MELVDDLYGKIKHILVTYNHSVDALFIDGLAKAFDEDVIISVAYAKNQKKEIGNPLKHLKKIARTHKNVLPFSIKTRHTPWIQDTIHVSENKQLMHHYPLNANNTEDIYDSEEGTNILDTHHWNDLGFKIIPNKSDIVIHGGDIIPCKDKIYIGNGVWYNWLYGLNFRGIDRTYQENSDEIDRYKKTGQITDIILKKKETMIENIKYLTENRKPEIMGVDEHKLLNLHLDLYFHPHDTGAFISKTEPFEEYYGKTLANFKEPSQDRRDKIEMLKLFNEQMEYKNHTTIPIIFGAGSRQKYDFRGYTTELYNKKGKSLGLNIRKHAIPFYSGLNAQYEIFEQDGKTLKRIYMPIYPELDGVNFEEIYQKTINSFTSQGFEVKTIPITKIDGLGSLRCVSKVLERT